MIKQVILLHEKLKFCDQKIRDNEVEKTRHIVNSKIIKFLNQEILIPQTV